MGKYINFLKRFLKKSIGCLNWNTKILFLIIFSLVPLLSAFVAEYIFQLRPCKLCLLERIPFFICLFIGIAILLIGRRFTYIWILCSLSSFVNTCLSFYHLMIERGFFTGPSSCSGSHSNDTVANITRSLLENYSPPCSIPSVVIAGLSMADINFVYSGGLTLIYMLFFFFRAKD